MNNYPLPDDVKATNDVTNSNQPISTLSSENNSAYTQLNPNKNTKRTFVFIAISIIIALGIIIALAWFFVLSKNSPESDSPSKATADKTSYPNVIASFAVQDITDGEDIVATTITTLGGQTNDGTLLFDFPAYRANDSDFKVLPVTGEGSAVVVPVTTAESNFKIVTDYYKNNDFKEVSNNPDHATAFYGVPEVTLSKYSVYESSELVCSVSLLSAPSNTQTQLIGTGCAEKSSYNEAKSSIASIAQSYIKAKNITAGSEDAKAMTFSNPEIKKTDNNYKHATVYIKSKTDSGLTLFYSKSESNDWKHVTKSQFGMIYCSELSKKEYSGAFDSVSCFDEATGTVRQS